MGQKERAAVLGHKGTKAQRHKGTKAPEILAKLALFAIVNPEVSFDHGFHGWTRMRRRWRQLGIRGIGKKERDQDHDQDHGYRDAKAPIYWPDQSIQSFGFYANGVKL